MTSVHSVQSVWTLVFALGAVQGFLLGLILLHLKGGSRAATRILAALVFVFTLDITEEFIEVAGLMEAVPHMLLSTFTLTLLIGPLLYLYGRYLLRPGRHFSWKDALHFLPFCLVTLYFLPFYLQSGADKILHSTGAYTQDVIRVSMAKGLHLITYLAATIYLMHRYLKRHAAAERSRRVKILWFRRLLYTMLAAGLGTGGLYYLNVLAGYGGFDSDYFGSLFLTSVIYAYAFVAIKYPGALTHVLPARQAEASPAVSGPGLPKYQTSPLDDEQKRRYLRLIVEYMEAERPYRNPQLGREDIARAVSLSAHNVSQIINELLGVNFYEFVNQYRVEEVKQNLNAPEHAHKTLLAIAFEAGFQSKTTFNRIFKQQTGQTPTQFRLAVGQE